MLSTLYDVEVPTINEHIKKIYEDGELSEEATIRNFGIVQIEGNLKEIQKNFFEFGACEKEMIEFVRTPKIKMDKLITINSM